MTTTRWARLTWQTADPDRLASDLARRLGKPAVRGGDGVWELRLGGETVEIVPWRREGMGDEPTNEGRLVFEPIEGGGPAPDRAVGASAAGLDLVGVAWSTVELDRAEAELDPWLFAPDPTLGDGEARPDPHLGARTRLRRGTSLPGDTLVLAEPDTEGRLAAALARDGEGPCALYLRPSEGLEAWVAAARGRHVQVSARRPGPMGNAVLLPGRAVAGPHLLVVDGPATRVPPSTIAP